MTEQTDGQPAAAQVRFARRFVIRRPDHPDMHGVEFPSGHVIADYPYSGLTGFISIEAATEGDGRATVHWADEEHCIHDAGIHHRHHHTRVDGCPWCSETGTSDVPTGGRT